MHRRCWPAPKLQSGQVTHTVLASCATPLPMLRGMPAPRKDSLEVGIAFDGSKYGVATVRYFVEKRDLLEATSDLTLVLRMARRLMAAAPVWHSRPPVEPQCDIRTGMVIEPSMVRVTPPSTSS